MRALCKMDQLPYVAYKCNVVTVCNEIDIQCKQQQGEEEENM